MASQPPSQMPHHLIPVTADAVAFYNAHDGGQRVRQGPTHQAEGKLFIQAGIWRDSIPGKVDMAEASLTQRR